MTDQQVSFDTPKTYDASRFERPSVTVDLVIFTLRQEQLQVLLVKRKRWPFEGMWALPGGFVRMDESLEEAARRLEHPESLDPWGEWVVVRRSDLEALSLTLRKVTGSGGRLPPTVVERYPELGAVRLEDGLDRAELDLLLTHRAGLQRLLRSL